VTDRTEMARALEALLFVADEPLPAGSLAQVLEEDRRLVEGVLEELARSYADRGAGLVVRLVAGGWQMATAPEMAPIVEQFVLSGRHARLTKASLETLAIVAYKQPVTRHQVAAIRGVNSDGVLRALVDRGLLAEVGREDGPGRPVLYGTTPEFLERLALPSLSALPSLAPLLSASAARADRDGDRDAEAEDARAGDGQEDVRSDNGRGEGSGEDQAAS
jgi:segregation and condensation protein B